MGTTKELRWRLSLTILKLADMMEVDVELLEEVVKSSYRQVASIYGHFLKRKCH